MEPYYTERGNGIAMVGKYNHSLDAKNRLFIPAKYREELGDRITITKNVDHSLTVYSKAEWDLYTQKIREKAGVQAREVLRFVNGNASDVELDSQGRAVIKQELLDYAGIDRNVVIVGCGSYAEIWSEEAMREVENTENTKHILDLMIEIGL